ncbi:MAG: prolyl oligopeptidase family serine peptidase [Motilibacteraceae bacterium]
MSEQQQDQQTPQNEQDEQNEHEWPADLPVWERRYRAARVSLPDWAEDAPDRCVYVSNATGTFEVHAWDRAAGTHRQVTERPNGTMDAAIDPAGERIWWFDDTDGDEYGVWRVQPFDGPAGGADRAGTDPEAVPGLPRAYSAGLALGRGGLAVVGLSDDDYGTRIVLARPGAEPVTVYQHEENAGVGDLSQDGTLLAIVHSEHGDSRHPAVRVLRTADASPAEATAADLWDGEGKGLEVLGFEPVDGSTWLLLQHERRGRGELLLWDVASGEQRELALDLPGEVSAEWYPDRRALLVEHEHGARSDLFRYDVDAGTLTPLGTPTGVVARGTARPGGEVWFSWSSSASPRVVLSTAGDVVLTAPGPTAPESVPAQDVTAQGPGGTIHALLSRPATGAAPYATVFLVHGGPTHHDSDEFAPDVAAWVDAGYAVVRVNYRGSTGYGSAWRDALEARVGHVELEDVAAVRAALVEEGVVDAGRTILAGASWGGFLTLLGLGTQPDLWALGVAGVPVADYVAAYEDEMEGLKAFDRSLFGGSPEEVPERYADSSPLTYVDAVRAPVLVLAGENDPRCPIRQIDNYLARLRERGAAHEVYRYQAGHGSAVVGERVRQQRAELDFALRHLPANP